MEQASVATLCLAGDWPSQNPSPPITPFVEGVSAHPDVRQVVVDATDLGRWGTGLAAALLDCRRGCEQRGIQFDVSRLPTDLQRLLQFPCRMNILDVVKQFDSRNIL